MINWMVLDLTKKTMNGHVVINGHECKCNSFIHSFGWCLKSTNDFAAKNETNTPKTLHSKISSLYENKMIDNHLQSLKWQIRMEMVL